MTGKTLQQKEVLDILNKLGFPIKFGTLRNYEKQKLITPPSRGSGYGGKWAEYQIWAVGEAATAWKLIHGKYGDASIAQAFSGRPPSINARTVALARAMFLEKIKETPGAMTEEGQKALEKEDLRDLQELDTGFLIDGSGYKYLVRFFAYVWRREWVETQRLVDAAVFG